MGAASIIPPSIICQGCALRRCQGLSAALAMWTTLLLLVALGTLALGLVARRLLAPAGNPFARPPSGPPRPLVTDPRARDKVLKQGECWVPPRSVCVSVRPSARCPSARSRAGFSSRRVPPELDAVVIGSGMGGLAAAATLAKVGKRVLVLEQHDQAGGCCHTFEERGCEFDVGKGQPAPQILTPLHSDTPEPWHPGIWDPHPPALQHPGTLQP